jgi:hypothetical protein
LSTFLEITRANIEKFYRGFTNPMRLIPDFIIIGAQRGGTTSLYNYLTDHPGVGGAFSKEVHFFDKSYQKGLMWYRAQFPSVLQKYYVEHARGQEFITGEASPYYLFHPRVPQRVFAVMPAVKLIVLLRNPVNRAYSQYYHEVDCGYETLSFEEAIESEAARTRVDTARIARDERFVSFSHQHHSYLARGLYVDQLKAWMDVFPREQFLILKSEDFYADPHHAMQQTLAFLGLGEETVSAKERSYKKFNDTKSPQMDLAMRKRLLKYFEPHNARLYEFLGRDFGWE